jgi:PilZ domain
MMTTSPISVERRVGQRFPFNLPVSLQNVASGARGLGFTQDVSSRGAFFFTDMGISPGSEIELTLKMPSEITLGEIMRVRCRGRVLRVVDSLGNGSNAETLPESAASQSRPPETKIDTKIGVAVCFNGYEYLADTEDAPSDFRRVATLHENTAVVREAEAVPVGAPEVAE